MADQTTLPPPKKNGFRLQELALSLPTRGVLRGGCRNTLAKLALIQANNPTAFIGNKALRTQVGCSENTLAGHIQDLTHLGLIKRKQIRERVHTVICEDRCRWWAEVRDDDPELKKLLDSLQAIRDKRNRTIRDENGKNIGRRKGEATNPVEPADAPIVVAPVRASAPPRRKLVFNDEPAPTIKRQRIAIDLKDGWDCDQNGENPFDAIMATAAPLNDGDPEPPDIYFSMPQEGDDPWGQARDGAIKIAREMGLEVTVVWHFINGERIGEEFPEPLGA